MPRSAYKCCVKNCCSKGKMSHRFPNPKRNMANFKLWINIIGGDLIDMDPLIVYEKKRVCANHFHDNDCSSGTKKLKFLAVPHLNVPSTSDSCSVLITTATSPKEQECDDMNISGIEMLDKSLCQSELEGISTLQNDSTLLKSSAVVVKYKKKPPIVRSFKKFGFLSKIGVSKVNQLTPKCKSLYKQGVLLNKRLRWEEKKASNFKSRLVAAEKFSGKVLNSKTSAAAIFTNLQLRETNRKARARRLLMQEKLLSLLLYKQSAKSYHILAKLFTLPGRKTLTNLLSKIPVNPGIDHTLMKVLKANIIKLSDKHKLCTVLFDEVSLDPNLTYDHSTGMITGFEDNGSARTQNFADHSLVFMIRGIVKKYKQPISYSFCRGTTSSYDLTNQLRNVIRAVNETGMRVVATICDQGATNTAAINILKKDTKADMMRKNEEYKEEFYNVESGGDILNIIHLYDPPHLLKGVRNNLLNKNVLFTIDGEQMEAC